MDIGIVVASAAGTVLAWLGIKSAQMGVRVARAKGLEVWRRLRDCGGLTLTTMGMGLLWWLGLCASAGLKEFVGVETPAAAHWTLVLMPVGIIACVLYVGATGLVRDSAGR